MTAQLTGCRYCDLVTDDPDRHFRPDEWDTDDLPDDVRCDPSPFGMHQPLFECHQRGERHE